MARGTSRDTSSILDIRVTIDFLPAEHVTPTFCMAVEGLGAQMGDTVTLEVLRPGEGLATALLRTDKATVIIMFPD